MYGPFFGRSDGDKRKLGKAMMTCLAEGEILLPKTVGGATYARLKRPAQAGPDRKGGMEGLARNRGKRGMQRGKNPVGAEIAGDLLLSC